MLHVRRAFQVALVATLSVATLARADEQLTPLAISGSWAALAHQSSIIAPPDVCVVFDVTSGVALHADAGGVQLRIVNKDWSLPAGVHGNIIVSIGVWKEVLAIDDNADDMVNAEVPQDVLEAMFAAMDKSTSMSVAVGNAKPLLVSLSGSTRATNAFRTCAGIKGNVATPGSNPFQ
jgi:hypothetical protein